MVVDNCDIRRLVSSLSSAARVDHLTSRQEDPESYQQRIIDVGQHADDFINDCVDRIGRLHDYASGRMTHLEAYDEGLIDEFGVMANEDVVMLPGVHDANSLSKELEITSLQLENSLLKINQPKPKVVHYWKSGDGKINLPQDMTTAHLQNAIAYAEKYGSGNTPIVRLMKRELASRT